MTPRAERERESEGVGKNSALLTIRLDTIGKMEQWLAYERDPLRKAHSRS